MVQAIGYEDDSLIDFLEHLDIVVNKFPDSFSLTEHGAVMRNLAMQLGLANLVKYMAIENDEASPSSITSAVPALALT